MVISNLYWNQKAAIRVERYLTEYTSIQPGVRQGCMLYPLPTLIHSPLLNTDLIFRDFNDLPGITIGYRLINNLQYADDSALLADTYQNHQQLMDAARKGSEDMGLSMNVKKTKTMVISREVSVKLLIDTRRYLMGFYLK